MANSARPFGLKPVRHIDGSPWIGQATLCVVLGADTSDYFIGDAVMFGGSGDANGIPSVIKYANAGNAATATCGTIVGVHKVRPTIGSLEGASLELEEKSLLGSITSDQFVMVVMDTAVVYECRSDTTGLRRNHIGSNVDITVTAPSNRKQLSATVLAGTGATGAPAATATFPFRIIGFKQSPDNEINASAATDEPSIVALVVPNEHAFKVGTLGLAV